MVHKTGSWARHVGTQGNVWGLVKTASPFKCLLSLLASYTDPVVKCKRAQKTLQVVLWQQHDASELKRHLMLSHNFTIVSSAVASTGKGHEMHSRTGNTFCYHLEAA